MNKIEITDFFNSLSNSKNTENMLYHRISCNRTWTKIPDSITGDSNRHAFILNRTKIIYNRNTDGTCSIGYKGNDAMNTYAEALKIMTV